jgi:hypothetical protein
MKGLPITSSDPSCSTAPRRHSSRALPFLLSAALIAIVFISNFGSSHSGVVEGAREAWREVKWAVTPLPEDPQERALKLLERDPIIGASPFPLCFCSNCSG